MNIIGVYSIKGGVGKTATTVNLAYLAAEAGHRTLVWDLDPQGAASYFFRIKPRVKGGGRGLLRGKRSPDDAIKGTDFEGLDLLPADFSYRNMDILLEGAKKKPGEQLRRLLKPFVKEYDLVLFDCPPSISLMSENIFRAADALLVPLIPSTLSARTLAQLLDFLKTEDGFGALRVLPFFSMVDAERALHTETIERLSAEHPEILPAVIPLAPEVERMGLHRMPLPAYAPSNAAAGAYRALWDELATAL
ncbi:cobyrinic acid a,c-diamide synthase [Thiohalocapsa halophila]|uniref:Cobyrinic acid a,c-diamide synthase n=1 Tax=Thiohalocapsa halophila TaxID=69359 RepID=A0ABS1CIY1_9GAMM|nr:AAA family ATPase [Thiohalocapsa halophila]MBK1631793.1 cobyrinic acid a,c-diamide synthase [Thiohalocapsa halophila]